MKKLTCINCNATAKDTSKERGRFLRRHPVLCSLRTEKRQFSKQLAQHVKSVAYDEAIGADKQ